MKPYQHILITGLVLVVFSVIAYQPKSDEDIMFGEDWVFMSPEWFLDNSSIDQTYYVNGILDTLNHIRVHGTLKSSIIDCIFSENDEGRVRIITGGFTNLVTNDRVESGDTDFSVASELFNQLEDECQLDIFR